VVFQASREGPVNIHAGPGSIQAVPRWLVLPSRDRGDPATAGARRSCDLRDRRPEDRTHGIGGAPVGV